MIIKARTARGVERFRRAGLRFDFRIRSYDVTDEQLERLKAESMVQICDDDAEVFGESSELDPRGPNEEELDAQDKAAQAERAAESRAIERDMNTERKALAREESEDDQEDDVETSAQDFSALNVGALRALCKAKHIDPKQNKAELVAALEAASE